MSRRLRRLQRRHITKKRPLDRAEQKTEVHEARIISSEETSRRSSHDKKSGFLGFYDSNYKKLLIIPILMLLLSIGFLGYNYATEGSLVGLGVSITGGVSVTATGEIVYSVPETEAYILEQFPESDVNARFISSAGETIGITVEASEVSEDEFVPVVREYLGDDLDYSIEVTGSSIGSAFFRQMLTALILAFVLMGIVVFISFRTVVPSLAVILSAASDMLVTLAIISLLDVKLSLAGIAAFLMLIGYSVDTDILLTTRVLKRKQGTVFERIMSAFETGFTMNLTTLAAITAGLIFSQSDVLSQIMLILFIGLMIDMVNTWIQNVGILRLYVEKKGDKE
ncbi:MAG: protein translocase subunit SecF [Candidatus Woesearchaeota archaeon]